MRSLRLASVLGGTYEKQEHRVKAVLTAEKPPHPLDAFNARAVVHPWSAEE